MISNCRVQIHSAGLPHTAFLLNKTDTVKDSKMWLKWNNAVMQTLLNAQWTFTWYELDKVEYTHLLSDHLSQLSSKQNAAATRWDTMDAFASSRVMETAEAHLGNQVTAHVERCIAEHITISVILTPPWNNNRFAFTFILSASKLRTLSRPIELLITIGSIRSNRVTRLLILRPRPYRNADSAIKESWQAVFNRADFRSGSNSLLYGVQYFYHSMLLPEQSCYLDCICN